MTRSTRQPIARLVAVLATVALVGAACGSASTSGPEAEVAVRVVDGETATAAATDAFADTDQGATDDTTGAAADTPVDDGGSTDETAADQTPTVAEGSIPLPSAADNIAIALPVLDELNQTNDEEPVTSPDVEPLVFGEINGGGIESVFGADYWTFSATEGQILTVEVLSIGAICRQDIDLYLADSQANRWDLGWIGNGGCGGHGPFILPTTGDYELQFVGGDGGVIEATTGEYQFIPRILTERDTNPVTFDEVQGGEISEIFGSDVWTFDATAGQVLAIEILAIGQSCRQDLDLFIIDPLGQREDVGWVGNGGCRAQGPFVLAESGTYALEFAGGEGGVIESTTGIYQFRASLT